MRFMFIRDHHNEFRVWLMCRVLAVSRSGYYAWLRRPVGERMKANDQLVTEIRQVYAQSRRTYGSPRITDELNDSGIACGRHRVARLMRRHDIRPVTVRKFRVTTDSRHDHPVAPNRLNREFAVDRPNRVWLSDITYIWTAEGWLYLAAVMDACSRRIVGYAMHDRIDQSLPITALGRALTDRRPAAGLIHHSDRGVQYAASDYRKLLSDHNAVSSMSRKGDCWDNAPMESFWGTLKQELVYQERFASRAEAKMKIFEYIEVFYNRQRRHSELGTSPAEFERLTHS